jgi:hypothetical protein
LRPRPPPPSAHFRPASTHAAAPRSLSLTSRPHPPAALSRALTPAGRPAPPVSRFVVLLAYGSSRSPPTVVPSIAHPLAAQKSLAPPRPRRLIVSLPGTAPAVRSCRRRCAALNAGVVHLTGLRRAPPLPSPRAPIKGPPRALPYPAPASATLPSPRPSSIRGSAVVFSLSGKSSHSGGPARN